MLCSPLDEAPLPMVRSLSPDGASSPMVRSLSPGRSVLADGAVPVPWTERPRRWCGPCPLDGAPGVWCDRCSLDGAPGGLVRSLSPGRSARRAVRPEPASLRRPFGLPCGARTSRGLAQTRLRLRQSRALIREALRSSAPQRRRLRAHCPPGLWAWGKTVCTSARSTGAGDGRGSTLARALPDSEVAGDRLIQRSCEIDWGAQVAADRPA